MTCRTKKQNYDCGDYGKQNYDRQNCGRPTQTSTSYIHEKPTYDRENYEADQSWRTHGNSQ